MSISRFHRLRLRFRFFIQRICNGDFRFLFRSKGFIDGGPMQLGDEILLEVIGTLLAILGILPL